MKKTILSTIAAIGILSSGVMAGGDIAPVTQVTPDSDDGFYITGKIGAMQTFDTNSWDYFSDGPSNEVMGAIGIGVGYRYSIDPDWFADLEVGIVTSFNGEDRFSRSDYDLTVRPGYRVTEDFDVYGILGASYVEIRNNFGKWDDWTPTLGAGVGYDITKNVKATVEYQYNFQDFDNIKDLRNDKIMVGLRYAF